MTSQDFVGRMLEDIRVNSIRNSRRKLRLRSNSKGHFRAIIRRIAGDICYSLPKELYNEFADDILDSFLENLPEEFLRKTAKLNRRPLPNIENEISEKKFSKKKNS